MLWIINVEIEFYCMWLGEHRKRERDNVYFDNCYSILVCNLLNKKLWINNIINNNSNNNIGPEGFCKIG